MSDWFEKRSAGRDEITHPPSSFAAFIVVSFVFFAANSSGSVRRQP
jgi:hypothetical protein